MGWFQALVTGTSTEAVGVHNAAKTINNIPGLNAKVDNISAMNSDGFDLAGLYLEPQVTIPSAAEREAFFRELRRLVGAERKEQGEDNKIFLIQSKATPGAKPSMFEQAAINKLVRKIEDNATQICELLQMHGVDTSDFKGFGRQQGE